MAYYLLEVMVGYSTFFKVRDRGEADWIIRKQVIKDQNSKVGTFIFLIERLR